MIESGMGTVIGSWPHLEPERIIDLILEKLRDIPVWPQLPKRSFQENMYVQFSEGFPMIRVDQGREKIWFDTSGDIFTEIQKVYENFLTQNYEYFRISEEYAAGLYSLRRKLSTAGKIDQVKGQILGPVSYGLTLTDENKRLIIYNEQMQDAILKCCIGKAVWQSKFLQECAKSVIVFIDEPYLVSYGSAYINITRDQIITMLNEVIDALHEQSIVTGIHCCGSTDWSLVMDTNVDIVNFDAFSYFESLLVYPQKINSFLANNKKLAWGIVPTAEKALSTVSSGELFESLREKQQQLVHHGVDSGLMQANTIITPSCGVGSISEEAAERALDLVYETSQLFCAAS